MTFLMLCVVTWVVFRRLPAQPQLLDAMVKARRVSMLVALLALAWIVVAT